MNKDFSIIIPTRNEGMWLRKTIDAIKNTIYHKNYEIIVVYEKYEDIRVIEDYKDIIKVHRMQDGSAAARNIGARFASGDVLIFCDSHVFPKTKMWAEKLSQFSKKRDVGICCPCISVHGNEDIKGYGGVLNSIFLTWDWLYKLKDEPFEIPIAPGACISIERKKFFEIGGFNKFFNSWGYEDVEISIRCWLLGYKCYVLPNIEVAHKFKEKHNYQVDMKEIEKNLFITCFLHFDKERFNAILWYFKQRPYFQEILKKIDWKELREEKMKLNSKKVMDFETYARIFNLNI